MSSSIDDTEEIEERSYFAIVAGTIIVMTGLIGSVLSFLRMTNSSIFQNLLFPRVAFALCGILTCLGVLTISHGWSKNMIASVALSFLFLAFYIFLSAVIGLI